MQKKIFYIYYIIVFYSSNNLWIKLYLTSCISICAFTIWTWKREMLASLCEKLKDKIQNKRKKKERQENVKHVWCVSMVTHHPSSCLLCIERELGDSKGKDVLHEHPSSPPKNREGFTSKAISTPCPSHQSSSIFSNCRDSGLKMCMGQLGLYGLPHNLRKIYVMPQTPLIFTLPQIITMSCPNFGTHLHKNTIYKFILLTSTICIFAFLQHD